MQPSASAPIFLPCSSNSDWSVPLFGEGAEKPFGLLLMKCLGTVSALHRTGEDGSGVAKINVFQQLRLGEPSSASSATIEANRILAHDPAAFRRVGSDVCAAVRYGRGVRLAPPRDGSSYTADVRFNGSRASFIVAYNPLG